MQDLFYRKDSFVSSESFKYELSIQVNPDGFLFLVRDPDSSDVLSLTGYRFSYPNENLLLRKIRDIYGAEEMMKIPFRKTLIFLSEPGFALIPLPLYSEKLAARILSGDGKGNTNHEIIIMHQESIDAILSFRVSAELLHFFREHHPGGLIGHELTPLLHNFGKTGTDALFIHIHDSWFYALSFMEGRPGFVNHFRYKSPEDLLYYLLSLVNLPEIRDIPLVLSGSIHEEDERFTLIRKYLPRAGIFCLMPGTLYTPPDSSFPIRLLPGLILF